MSTLLVEPAPAVSRAELRRQLRQARQDRAAAGDDAASWVEATVRMRSLERQLRQLPDAVPVQRADVRPEPAPVAPVVAVEPAPAPGHVEAATSPRRLLGALGGRWGALALVLGVVAVSALLAPVVLLGAGLVLLLSWQPARRALFAVIRPRSRRRRPARRR